MNANPTTRQGLCVELASRGHDHVTPEGNHPFVHVFDDNETAKASIERAVIYWRDYETRALHVRMAELTDEERDLIEEHSIRTEDTQRDMKGFQFRDVLNWEKFASALLQHLSRR